MSWDTCGFPNINIAPVGRPLYALEEAAKFFWTNIDTGLLYSPTFFKVGYTDSGKFQKYADFKTFIVKANNYMVDYGYSLYHFDRDFVKLLKKNFYYKILYETGISPDDSKVSEEINNFLGEELIDYSDANKNHLYKMPGWDSRWAIQRYRLFRDMPIYTTCMCTINTEEYYHSESGSKTGTDEITVEFIGDVIDLVHVSNSKNNIPIGAVPRYYYIRETPKNIVTSMEDDYFSSEMRVQDFRVWFTVLDHEFSDFGTGYKVGDSFFCESSSDVITAFPDFDFTNYQPSESEPAPTSGWSYRFRCEASPVVRLEPLNKEWMTGGKYD